VLDDARQLFAQRRERHPVIDEQKHRADDVSAPISAIDVTSRTGSMKLRESGASDQTHAKTKITRTNSVGLPM